jgi:hypothetical protein
VCIDESQKPADVEFEYAVWKGLVAFVERTMLISFIEFELGSHRAGFTAAYFTSLGIS